MINKNLVISVFFLIFTTFLYSQDSTFFPLSKGTKWTYKGNVKWQEVDNPAVFDSTIIWEVKVVDVYKGNNFIAAELEGSLGDLTFYERGRKPEKYIIISAGNKYYSVTEDNPGPDKTMKKIKDSSIVPADIISGAEILLKNPLKLNDVIYAYTDSLTFPQYAWLVNGVNNTLLREIIGVNPTEKRDVCEMTYKTNPDITIVDFSPGIGIINFIYEHRGSASSCDMKLIMFER